MKSHADQNIPFLITNCFIKTQVLARVSFLFSREGYFTLSKNWKLLWQQSHWGVRQHSMFCQYPSLERTANRYLGRPDLFCGWLLQRSKKAQRSPKAVKLTTPWSPRALHEFSLIFTGLPTILLLLSACWRAIWVLWRWYCSWPELLAYPLASLEKKKKKQRDKETLDLD